MSWLFSFIQIFIFRSGPNPRGPGRLLQAFSTTADFLFGGATMAKRKKEPKGAFEGWDKECQKILEKAIVEIEALGQIDDFQSFRDATIERLKDVKQDISSIFGMLADVVVMLTDQKDAQFKALADSIKNNNDIYTEALRATTERIDDLRDMVFFNQIMITSHVNGKPMTREQVLSMGAEYGMEPSGEDGEQSVLFTMGLSAMAARA